MSKMLGGLFGMTPPKPKVSAPQAPAEEPIDPVDPQGILEARKRKAAEALRRGRSALRIDKRSGTNTAGSSGLSIP